jgi:glycosyltransferase involved in cell wall biosynthesis
MTYPKVSVILPTYNRVEYIKQSIVSVLKQTLENIELIVIDDGSEDNTENVVVGISDERIKYVKNKTNIGVTKSLNRGIEIASGKYIARIDDQDEWGDDNKLKKQVGFLEDNEEYVLIGTGVVVTNTKGGEKFRYLKPVTDNDIRRNMLQKNCFAHPSVVFCKDAFEKVGGYNESVKVGQDYDLWLRLGKIGKMRNLSEYAIRYVDDDQGVSSRKKKEQIKQNFYLITKHRKDYPGYLKGVIRNIARLIIYGYLNIGFSRKITGIFSK